MKRSPGHPLLVFLFYLLICIIVIVTPVLFFWLPGESVAAIIIYTIIILVSLVFLRLLGLKIQIKGFLAGPVAAIVAMTLIFLTLMALGVIRGISLRDNFMLYLLIGVVLQLFVAFGEELSFRASIFQGLYSFLDFRAAAILSAAAFALLHIPSMLTLGVSPVNALIGICSIVLAGIVLALLYHYGGLLNAVGFHFFWNFLEYHAFSLGSLQGALNVTETGSTILSGGSFGPEASILALPIMAGLAILIWVYYNKIARKTGGSPLTAGYQRGP